MNHSTSTYLFVVLLVCNWIIMSLCVTNVKGHDLYPCLKETLNMESQ